MTTMVMGKRAFPLFGSFYLWNYARRSSPVILMIGMEVSENFGSLRLTLNFEVRDLTYVSCSRAYEILIFLTHYLD